MRMLIGVVTLLVASSVMAAEDQCSLQLAKLKDQAIVSKTASGAPGTSPAVNKLIDEAKAAQAKGDLNHCERSSQEALTLMKASGGGSGTQ